MINYENCPVNVAGYDLFANSASISVQNQRRGLKRHGTQGSYGQVNEGRLEGSVSVSYNIAEGDTGIRGLTGINVFNVTAGPFQCYSGVLTSYSMNIQPNSIVSCDVDISFYGGYDQTGIVGTIESSGDLMHGGTTNVDSDLLWNNDIISCSYSVNQSIEPIYKLGEFEPFAYKRSNGSISVNLQGTGLGKVLSLPCDGYTTGNISLQRLCAGGIVEIPFSGFASNPSLEISPQQEIVGSIEVFDTF
tara:strand:+ start:39803 stop:40543 length:741 start_codon:yes stop_codon:yes gene_type:complete